MSLGFRLVEGTDKWIQGHNAHDDKLERDATRHFSPQTFRVVLIHVKRKQQNNALEHIALIAEIVIRVITHKEAND